MKESDDWNRYEGLECDEDFAGYLMEAMTEGPVGFVDALSDVGVARFINHLADATGIDRRELCAVFAGHAVLDEASMNAIAQMFSVPVLVHA